MHCGLIIPILALIVVAGLLAAGPQPDATPPPRPLPDPVESDIDGALDDLAREIAREEGRIDFSRLRALLTAALEEDGP